MTFYCYLFDGKCYSIEIAFHCGFLGEFQAGDEFFIGEGKNCAMKNFRVIFCDH